MGRFSRLETGQADANNASGAGAVADSQNPATADEGVMDAAGCVAHGDRLLFMEERRSALRWYSRAIDLDSTRIDAWTRMIMVLFLRGDVSEAAAWIGRALAAYPETPSLVALRAVDHARRGMIRQAMAATDAVLQRAGADPIVHIARGEVLLLAHNKIATYCFDQAVKMTPTEDWKTPIFVALIHRERHLWAKAIDYLALAIDRQERQPLIWFQIGLCRASMGHRAQAEKAFQTAAELTQADDPLQQAIRRAATGSFWNRLRGILHLHG